MQRFCTPPAATLLPGAIQMYRTKPAVRGLFDGLALARAGQPPGSSAGRSWRFRHSDDNAACPDSRPRRRVPFEKRPFELGGIGGPRSLHLDPIGTQSTARLARTCRAVQGLPSDPRKIAVRRAEIGPEGPLARAGLWVEPWVESDLFRKTDSMSVGYKRVWRRGWDSNPRYAHAYT